MATNERNILITGAAGLLGSHLVDSMLKRGYTVTGIDNLSIGNIDNLSEAMKNSRFTFIRCDVRDEKTLKGIAPHAVIVHFAAYKIEVPGLKGTDILEINSLGTSAMLKLARRWDSRFVFSSTSDVYGRSPHFPFREDGDLMLGESTVSRWGYAASKIFDEHLCFAYQRQYNTRVTVIRYFNTYGPRHELSRVSGGPQALFLDALLRGNKMTIHGNGSQRRCFAYVSDTIEMTARAIEEESTIGEILNIGNPNDEISILELAKLAHEITGKPGPVPLEFISHANAYKTEKFQEVNRRIPDISKAERLLGYTPRISNREGLKLTYEWQKKLSCYRGY